MEAKDMQPMVDEFIDLLQAKFKDEVYDIDAFLIGYLSSFIANAALDNPAIANDIRDRMQMMQPKA